LTYNEDELVRRAQLGETEALCLLAEEHERRIYSLALRYCHNPHDAEDLSQEVWLKASHAIRTFRGESSFYTWLRKIAVNCFLNHRRQGAFCWRGETTEVQLVAVDAVDGERPVARVPDSEMGLHNRVLIGRVFQALSELSPQQKVIFLLKHCEGMTYEEIAQAVGCSTGTAKKSVSRSITKLRKHLADDSESADGVPCTVGQY
jgi:RNA polymerase sigma-70 factor (ECF subfamily)